MTNQEKINKVQSLLQQYAKSINAQYPVFISGIQVKHEQLNGLEALKYPPYKYSISIDVLTQDPDSNSDKLVFHSDSEHWIDLDNALKPKYKYHFMRDVARDVVDRNDPVCIRLTYMLIKDAYESEFKSGKNNDN